MGDLNFGRFIEEPQDGAEDPKDHHREQGDNDDPLCGKSFEFGIVNRAILTVV